MLTYSKVDNGSVIASFNGRSMDATNTSAYVDRILNQANDPSGLDYLLRTFRKVGEGDTTPKNISIIDTFIEIALTDIRDRCARTETIVLPEIMSCFEERYKAVCSGMTQ